VLLTGATGFVGRAVLERGSDQEWVAVARTAPPDWGRELAHVEWVKADLTSPGLAQALPSDFGAVVHLARSRRQRDFPDGAIDDFEVNVGTTARLLDHARLSGAQRFVLASTATVYAPSAEPLTEDAALSGTPYFAACKRAAELLVAAYAGQLQGVVLRLFTAYGPGQSGQLISELVERVRGGESIVVEGRRGLLLSPIHVDDIADAVLASLAVSGHEGGEPLLLNIGGPDRLGIREIGEKIGWELGIEARFDSREGGEPGGYLADCSRALRRLGVPEPVAFREGLARTLASEGGTGPQGGRRGS